MSHTLPVVDASPGDPTTYQNATVSEAPSWAGAARMGILWILAATCLFVGQDSTARILVKTYPVTEVAYFVHIVLVGLFIAWRDPRLVISCRPMLQMVRSSFLLGATLFVMLPLGSCRSWTFPP